MALTRREAPATRKPTATVKRGTGSGDYTVKHVRATAKQREVIDGCLTQAKEDRASRRVMIAVVMCITQESGAGEAMNVMTGNDDVGIFQQGRNWISVEGSKDPAASTHAFLTSPKQGWKAKHGGVKKAPGNLSLAIHAVQSNQDPMAYAPWEGEATKTVDTWLGEDGGGDGGGGSYNKRYTFTRGEKGGSQENSWDAMGRLMEEVGAHRWAVGNVLYAASGDELRAGAPSLTIRGTEGWLRKQPAWSWASGRAISEVTLEVLADRWDVMPGACVVLHRSFGAMSGRWLCWNVSGPSLVSPEATIVLRRPTCLRSEPPHDKGTRQGTDNGAGGKTGGADGKWRLAAGANRPGVSLTSQIKGLLDDAATWYDGTLVVTTGTNHNQTTTSGSISNHWSGNAADLGMVANGGTNDGPVGDKIAIAFMRACGLSYREAAAAIPGSTQFNRDYKWKGKTVEIGWRTDVGGNHHNHVHVGISSR